MATTRTLSEQDSKLLLAPFGIPFAREELVADGPSAEAAVGRLGGPAALKLCGDHVAHKTERGLVRLGVGVADAAGVAEALLAAGRPEDGVTGVLVAEMVTGTRELIAGVATDPQFGPTVLLGVGGVLAEAVADVAVRLLPVSRADALDMVDQLALQALLGEFRGEPAVDREAVADVLVALGDVVAAHPEVVSVDLNPLVVHGGRPVAVDALVEVADPGPADGPVDGPVAVAGVIARRDRPRPTPQQMAALFEPRGVVVAGASTHPGKFGFVTLHNLLAAGFAGRVGATNLEGATVLGVSTVPSVDDLDDGPWDLMFVCTPPATVPELLRAAARKGVRAAFLTTAGYGEAGEAGVAAEAELVALCDELGILLAGPNGQGVVSTPVSLCAQIVAPYPPAGRIAVASQSGNFVSSFMNWACATGVGISRAVSAGNAAATGVGDYLRHYAADPATAVSLAYVEGVADGAAFRADLSAAAAARPVVVVKGGATAGGARAAASHTGSLATDDRAFEGLCRQVGATRAATVEEAFEAAATFATQPLPPGNRVLVLTTAGGWGVVTADAVTRHPDLELATLAPDLVAALDDLLPPRWSRNNPVDLAGGETRDTVPQVLELVASHPDVDAVVHLGVGIQSNQARLMREGPFYPEHGLERIVDFHERQDARYAAVAQEVSERTGKPVLVATELAVAFPGNAGPATVRGGGRLCYPSADRAVAALGHLVRRRHFLDRPRP